jgi:hypothetical protein
MTIGFFAFLLFCYAGCEKSTPTDTTAPAAPVLLPSPADSARDETGTDAIPAEDWIQVVWLANSENDMRGYNIYRSSPPQGILTLLATKSLGSGEPDTVFEDTMVELGVRYSYMVTAYDRAGNESAGSQEVDYLLIPKLSDENLSAPRGQITESRPEFSWTSTGESIENYLRVYDTVEQRTVWVSQGQNPFSSPHSLIYNENGTAIDTALVRGREYWWRVDRTGSELRSGSESHWVSFRIEN